MADQRSAPSPASQAAAVAALVDAQTRMQDQVNAGLAAWIRRVFASFTAWYDERAASQVVVQVAPQVMTAQQSVASATAAYLAQVLAVYGVGAPIAASAAPTYARDADILDVYSRPMETYRYQRSIGHDDEASASAALNRALVAAENDVNLGMQAGTRRGLERISEVVGYRRVLRPELSKTGSCGLCIAASDRIYKRGDLMPLHGWCNCKPMPILAGGQDPGRSLNDGDLDRLYSDAGGGKGSTTDGRALKRTRYQVDEHGELGPLLVPVRPSAPRDGRSPVLPGQGSVATKAAGTTARVGGFAEELSRLEKTLPTFQSLADGGDRNAAALVKARQARITELRQRLSR